MKKKLFHFYWGLLFIFLSGCSLSTLLTVPTPTIDLPAALTDLAPDPTSKVQSQEQTQQEVIEPTEIPIAEPEKNLLWISPALPESLTQGLVAPVVLEQVQNQEAANLYLEVGETGRQVTSLIYALVAPFPSLVDRVSFENLKNAWFGNLSGKFTNSHIYVTQPTYVIFQQWWGNPIADIVRVVAEEELLSTTWSDANSWALVPFEALRPEWKVIQVDGFSPIWKEFNPIDYPLRVPVSLRGSNTTVVNQLSEAFINQMSPSFNRDPDKLTTLVLTGVTALVRATAVEMEQKGILYPADEIAPLLQSADILHISNEVPFATTCPPPKPVSTRLVFCSADKYLELLEYIGTDVVELTGDHFSDWGTEATLHTFDLYDAEGWMYYGGGRTPELGRLPIKLEHNGNKIAFIGCNGKGGSYTPSTYGAPGAVDCDFNLIASEIAKLKEEGYLVIMTFQHQEVYSFTPSPYLVVDFEFTADAGADIVSGSQAHQPHGMAFYHGSMIMYGLGNLFFDQLLISEDTSRALIARHVIYGGKHISTEIFTIHFIDFSRPLYLEGDERIRLLKQVFAQSDWGDLSYAGNNN